MEVTGKHPEHIARWLSRAILEFLRAPSGVLMTPQLGRDFGVAIIARAFVMRVGIDHRELALFERRRLAPERARVQANRKIRAVSLAPLGNEFHAIDDAAVEALLDPDASRVVRDVKTRRRATRRTRDPARRDRKSRLTTSGAGGRCVARLPSLAAVFGNRDPGAPPCHRDPPGA